MPWLALQSFDNVTDLLKRECLDLLGLFLGKFDTPRAADVVLNVLELIRHGDDRTENRSVPLDCACRDAAVPMMCCGQKMTKLEPGVVEASHEKHIPVVSVDGNIVTVTIGSVEHPMLEEHHIEWVYLQTDKGGQRKCLEVGKPPVVTFALSDEKPIAAYEYCNLHGLWKADI